MNFNLIQKNTVKQGDNKEIDTVKKNNCKIDSTAAKNAKREPDFNAIYGSEQLFYRIQKFCRNKQNH